MKRPRSLPWRSPARRNERGVVSAFGIEMTYDPEVTWRNVEARFRQFMWGVVGQCQNRPHDYLVVVDIHNAGYLVDDRRFRWSLRRDGEAEILNTVVSLYGQDVQLQLRRVDPSRDPFIQSFVRASDNQDDDFHATVRNHKHQ